MATSLVLACLMAVCSLSFGQECPPAFSANIDFPGTDMKFVYSPDAQHCQQLCTWHPTCQFFTFVRPDWTRDNRHFYCYLKKTPSGQPKVRTPLLGVTSGFSLKSCSSFSQPCLSAVYQNTNFPGEDYQTLFTSTAEECQRACTHDPGCQFYTFINGLHIDTKHRFKCYLKFSWPMPITPIIEKTTGVESGFSHRMQMSQNDFETECQGQVFPNTNAEGVVILTAPAVNPRYCQAMCSAHPSCIFFTHDSSNFNCHLKSNREQMVLKAEQGVTSGIPARFCQLSNSSILTSYPDVDFRGSDIGFNEVDDADVCQKQCTDDPHCQFYAFAHKNFHDAAYWSRCYRKSVITIPAPPKVTKEVNHVAGFSLKNCGE